MKKGVSLDMTGKICVITSGTGGIVMFVEALAVVADHWYPGAESIHKNIIQRIDWLLTYAVH